MAQQVKFGIVTMDGFNIAYRAARIRKRRSSCCCRLYDIPIAAPAAHSAPRSGKHAYLGDSHLPLGYAPLLRRLLPPAVYVLGALLTTAARRRAGRVPLRRW